MPYANPLDNAQAPLWHFVVIAGRRTPGVCDVSDAERTYKWDVKSGPGTQGETATYQGFGLAKFKIRLRMWTPEQIAEWDELRPLLKYDAGRKSVEAVDVTYPSLTDQDIFAAVVESIGALHVDAGLATVEIGCIEYRPPPRVSATKTPSTVGKAQAGAAGSTGGVSAAGQGHPADSIIARQQGEIGRLTEEAADL